MVYILLADGFETIEALAPYDMLKRAQIEVQLVCMNPIGLEVCSSHGIKVFADVFVNNVDLNKMDMLVIPGGMPGTKNIDSHENIDGIIEYAVKNNCYMAAICAGPSVLGKRGVLKGREAVCFPGFECFLEGANIQNKRVVTDGRIITAIGAGAAIDFGLELVRILLDKDTAEKIRSSIH